MGAILVCLHIVIVINNIYFIWPNQPTTKINLKENDTYAFALSNQLTIKITVLHPFILKILIYLVTLII